MNEKQIAENYSHMETMQLKVLCESFEGLDPMAVPLLQLELINRGETELAIGITKKLVSSKYICPSDEMFAYLLKQVKENLSENQLDEKLKKDFAYDDVQLEILKARFKEAGKNNLFFGSGLILLPLVFGLIVFIEGGYVAGLLTVIFIISGIRITVKGYKQLYGFKNVNK